MTHSSSRLQLVRAGMACRHTGWLPTSQLSRRSPETVMRTAFRRDCRLKSQATLAFVQFTGLVWCSFMSIILMVWFGLGPLCFLLGDWPHPGIREEIEQAGLLITLSSVLHFPAEQDVLSSEVPPVPQADPPAIMLQLDGSPPLGGNLEGVQPLLLVEPPLALFEGQDLLFLGCQEVYLVEPLPQASSEPFEDIFRRRGGIYVFGDGHPPVVQLLQEAVEVEAVSIVHAGPDVLRVFPHGGVRGLADLEPRL